MKLIINGKPKELAENLNLKEMIDQLSLPTTPAIAEINGNIIKQNLWHTIPIKDGDCVELINFVGGG